MDIKYGWLIAAIDTENGQIGISNTYLGGRHMPAIFLNAIIELFNKKRQEIWICWHGESNSYIWHLIVKKDRT